MTTQQYRPKTNRFKDLGAMQEQQSREGGIFKPRDQQFYRGVGKAIANQPLVKAGGKLVSSAIRFVTKK